MHIRILAIAVILILSACGGGEAEKPVALIDEPADLIPEDKMIQVIADVHVLESVVGYKMPQLHINRQGPMGMPGGVQTALPVMPVDTNQKPLPLYDIFAKYGYTMDQFKRSNEWYAQDAQQYSVMYDEVINELTRRQAELLGSKTGTADSVQQ